MTRVLFISLTRAKDEFNGNIFLIDGDDLHQEHENAGKRARIEDSPVHKIQTNVVNNMTELSISDLLDIIGQAQVELKRRLGCH